MKIVIDIPEEAYNLLQNDGVDWLGAEHILDRVAKGTPLPKGHGRLIDENNLFFEDIDDISCVTQRNVENAPTIIEAESEEENEKEQNTEQELEE